MNLQLHSLIEESKRTYASELGTGKPRVTVTLDTSSIARGADIVLERIREVIDSTGLKVDIATTGSWGFNWLEPCVSVRSAAGTRTILYKEITPDLVGDFIQTVLVDGDEVPEWALGVVEGNATPEIPLLADHPFMVGQTRRLMARLGMTDPENIDHYLATGGYVGFSKALDLTDEAIIKEVLDSGLGGRGGGGFPAGRKWDFLRTATADPKYLVCNADEGDPGSWVNRILMEGDPQLIIEGMLIAALATGAREGYVYIRYEYPLAFERMQKAVDQALEKGLLGENILGTGKDFDVVIFRGAGSYVCGEETGLINSIDGYRGMPRIKPPFPAQAGLWNKPTNVNNVETYANAPLIMENGAAWWAEVSEAKEKGTKMFTFSGSINQAGCVEVPFGISMRELLEHYAGGLKDGSVLKGFQPGGPPVGHSAGSRRRPPARHRPLPRKGHVPWLRWRHLLRPAHQHRRPLPVDGVLLRVRIVRPLHHVPGRLRTRHRIAEKDRQRKCPRIGYRPVEAAHPDARLVELPPRPVHDDCGEGRTELFRRRVPLRHQQPPRSCGSVARSLPLRGEVTIRRAAPDGGGHLPGTRVLRRQRHMEDRRRSLREMQRL